MDTIQQKKTSNNLIKIVRELVFELHTGNHIPDTITLDSILDRDLGIDSLSRVELLIRIEKKLGVTVSEHVINTAETLRDIFREISPAALPKKYSIRTTKSAIIDQKSESISEDFETLVQVLEWHAVKHPENVHIRLYSDDNNGDEITYHDLWAGALNIAVGLQQLGLNYLDTVIIMLPSGRDYFFSFFGVLIAGGIPVPVYPPGRPKQIKEHMQRHVAITENRCASIMITVPEATRFAGLLQAQTETLQKVVTVDDLISSTSTYSLKNLRSPKLNSNNIAFLQYTSGSTGLPKGVILTHENLLANIKAMGRIVKVTSKDVFVSWLPLYHDMGLIGAWLGSMYYGCQLVLMPPLAFITRPERWFAAIHRYKGTLSAAPNFAYELCLRRINDKQMEGIDLSSWRCAFNGAEAVSPQTVEHFTEKFSRFGFKAHSLKPVYGLAESSVGLVFPPNDREPVIDNVNRRKLMVHGKAVIADTNDTDAIRFVSSGRPLPGHQVRIVDDSDRELPERHQGKIQFTGPSATSGYFRNPEGTAALFHREWLESGDLGYIAGGELYITGRSKDIIIKAGRNIYPEELEEVIGKLQGLRSGNIAVFGSLQKKARTERLIILAETRLKDPIVLKQLRSDINEVVSDITGSPPDEIVFAPPNTVLKTSSGKIRRSACRELFEKGAINKRPLSVRQQLIRITTAGLLFRVRELLKSATSWMYASYCWMLFGTATVFVWPIVILLPVETWRWFFIGKMVKLLSCLTGISIIVQGHENLPLVNTPCIFIANHASYLDPLAVITILQRPVSFIAKRELLEKFTARVFLKRLNTQFVERLETVKSIKDAKKLDNISISGRTLFFFVEGTFSRMPGLLPFRMGAFEVASRTERIVVPLSIRGTRSILRSDTWFPRRGIVHVVIGKPIYPRSIKEKNNGEIWQTALELRKKTREWILKHCGEPDLEYEHPRISINASSKSS